MGENSKISWTDHTFNPWIGCAKVSHGCLNCYAEAQDKFRHWTPDGFGNGKPRKRTSKRYWDRVIGWEGLAKKHGDRPKVFCASLADWLDPEVPIEWFIDLLKLVFKTPHLDWLLLTKRIEFFADRLEFAYEFAYRWEFQSEFVLRLNEWLQAYYDAHPCESVRNVWVGTTVESQSHGEKRVPELLKIPAGKRFLSCEPLLGPLNFVNMGCGDLEWVPESQNCFALDWVIVGGESGPHSRKMDLSWVKSIKEQCEFVHDGIPFFFKQWGGVRPDSNGHLLDGISYQNFPDA